MIKRTLIIILDSVGCGELPDARDYGDEGSNTLFNTARAVGGLSLPYLEEMGLGNICEIDGVPKRKNPIANYGKCGEASPGKDSTTGHWELMGLQLKTELPLFPDGFPKEIIDEFINRTGRGVIGNKVASGTEIIVELGEEHLKSGDLIVYTSADSVFQIAAHDSVVSIDDLYRYCRVAREMLKGKTGVGRVIARPFTGPEDDFKRTEWRKDFSLRPPGKTVLDYAAKSGMPVYSIGKISELFAGQGITTGVHTGSNKEGIDQIIGHLQKREEGIIFANLVDFDMLWGHRNNAKAYAVGLKEVDERIPEITALLGSGDLLILTADHGCDPTTASTDHSREYVPLLVYGEGIKNGIDLGTRKTFSDVGKTIADAMNFKAYVEGSSFWPEII